MAVIEVDQELIDDFRVEFDEAYEAIEGLLIELEKKPDSENVLNDIFRRVHSIKSNLRMVGMDLISDLVHVIEHLLEDIRSNILSFDNRLSDVVLLSIDRVKVFFETVFSGGEIEEDELRVLEQAIRAIKDGGADQLDETISKAMLLLDDHYVAEADISHIREDLTFFS